MGKGLEGGVVNEDLTFDVVVKDGKNKPFAGLFCDHPSLTF